MVRKELPELSVFLASIPNLAKRIDYTAAINLPSWFPKDGRVDAYSVYEVILKSGTLNDPFNNAFDEQHWEEPLVGLLACTGGMTDKANWKVGFEKVLEDLCAAATTAHTDRRDHYLELAKDYPKSLEMMAVQWQNGIPIEILGE